MKNLLTFESWKTVNESKGVSRAIYNHLVTFFDEHGEKGSYEDAKKYVASKVEDWDLSKEDYEEAKKEWDLLKDQINDTLHQIELLENGIKHNKEKLSHLEEHEYDPNCNFCMNNVFVKDAIETQKKVDEQGNQLETLNILYGALVTQAGKIADVEEQWETLVELKSKYQKAIVIKEKAEAESLGFDTKKELLEHQLQSVKDNIQKYHDNEETIKRNAQIDAVISGLQKTKSEIELEIKNITKDIAGVNGSISSISSFIEGIKGKMSDVKELEEKNRLYTYYLDAVKRDGIPYELISKALPVIENEVNNILSQVVDFGVVMDVDGKSINAKIVYDDQEWPLEMCSGMEKFVSGLAIRVALINVCNLPRPNFLVIDEGFGTLDSDNLSSLFMMMQYLKTQFDFIWVISHLEQMRDIVDGLIEIKKENGFSKIDF
jgi:DNA repair exonuclease SbcCD ATPase subunit